MLVARSFLSGLLLPLFMMALSVPTAANCTGEEINLKNPELAVGLAESSDCGAHEFAWNAFLALNAPAPGSSDTALYQTYMPVAGLFVGEGEAPDPWGEQPPWQMLGKMFKEAGVEVELVDTAGEKVLFGIAANKVAYDYLVNNRLYNQQCFLNHDINFPFGSAATGPGSILLKTAWRIYDLGECPADMICENVVLEDQAEGDAEGAGPAKSAGLLGMHVAQKTPGHQEWIWASFEHIANAPDCSPGGSNPIANNRDWHLFQRSSDTQVACNVSSSEAPVCNTPDGTTRNICKVSAIAAGGLENCEVDNPDNEQALACLNASITQRLPEASALRNYRLIGTLRMESGISDTSLGGDQAGSLALANTSMESYLQGPDNLSNCFSCHARSSGDFSHVFFRINQHQPIDGCPLVK